MNVVLRAIEASDARSQAEFAKKIGRSQSYVWKCVKSGYFPRSIIPVVEAVSGVPRHILDPEYFSGYAPVDVSYSDNPRIPNDRQERNAAPAAAALAREPD